MYIIESVEEKYRPTRGGKNTKDYCQGDSNKNGSKVSKNLLSSKPEALILEPGQ